MTGSTATWTTALLILAVCSIMGFHYLGVEPQRERKISDKLKSAVHNVIYARFVRNVAPHVDWDRLRDEYERIYGEQKTGVRRQLQRSRAKPFWTEEEYKPVGHSNKRAHHAVIHSVLDTVEEGIASSTGRDEDSPRPPESPIASALDQEFIDVEEMIAEEEKEGDTLTPVSRQGDDASFNGKPITAYVYSPGENCGDATQTVPCAPANIRETCAKGGTGKLSACLEVCIPSFCCIHDAPADTNFIAPNCNTEPNCAQYAPCYIVWWKLHDTIGPATLLQLEQNDDFFDITASDISGDVTGVEFLQEMLFHHFDDATAIIEAGTVDGAFTSDRIFLDPAFWDAESVLP